jgi:hypothetical protein
VREPSSDFSKHELKFWLAKGRVVGSLKWFSFMLFRRAGQFSPILYGKALLQELMDDMYVRVKRSQTNYLWHNQDKLKVKNYKGLVESLKNKNNPSGKKVVLPSSFIGSPCVMSQLYQDTMAICRVHEAPSLFITMTANPNWPEVREVIPEGANAADHPAEMVRIAYLKIKCLLFELVEMRRLGRVIAYVSTIEFQKRGLPHIHLMLTLDKANHPDTPEKIDLLVLAEIPNPIEEPELHTIITGNHFHGPCPGRPCWNGLGCKQGFPKPFSDRTVVVDGAYPVYKRRDNGRLHVKNGATFNNSHVALYNKFLRLMFQCHINVEIRANTTAVKYIYKYITKGHDQSMLKIDGNDEIKSLIDGRYLSPPEGNSYLQVVPVTIMQN